MLVWDRNAEKVAKSIQRIEKAGLESTMKRVEEAGKEDEERLHRKGPN